MLYFELPMYVHNPVNSGKLENQIYDANYFMHLQKQSFCFPADAQYSFFSADFILEIFL